MKNSFYLVLFSLFAVPVFAGEATIVETDTAIIVEYSGSEEDKQATLNQIEEREKQLADEREKEEYKKAAAARRAEAKKTYENE